MKKISTAMIFAVLIIQTSFAQSPQSLKESQTRSEVIEFVLFVNKDNLIELNGRVLGSDFVLGGLKTYLDQEFVELSKKSSSQSGFEKLVIVKANDTARYEYVVKTIAAVRKSEYPFKVIASNDSTDPYVFVPQEQNRRLNLKPNPLTLVVTVESNGNLKLNNERQGNISNFDRLKNRLADEFEKRREYKAYRIGTTIVETTTFVKASLSMKFGDVKKVVNAVKEAGASPVYLQIDSQINDLDVE